MSIVSTQKDLKLLISKGRHEEVIEHLLSLSSQQPNDISDQIYSISASFKNLKSQIAFGTISDEREEVSTNDIIKRLLDLINLLEEPSVSRDIPAVSQQRIKPESTQRKVEHTTSEKNQIILLSNKSP